MIQVKKKELQERKFTPYEITITIVDEKEHNELQREILEIEGFSSDRWYRLKRRYGAITQVLNYIKNHTK